MVRHLNAAQPPNLTDRQNQVLQMIRDHLQTTGYPPTRAEISAQLGFRSANAAEDHLRALARKGRIEIASGVSRGIRLRQPLSMGLPIVGRVAAGNPILAEEHIEEYCEMPDSFFSPPADYLLQIQGMSMKDIGILDGDLLAVHSCPDAEERQVVVARLDDEVTVKRLRKGPEPWRLRLEAENPDFDTLEVDLREREFAIEGRAVGILRRNSR